MSRAAIHQYKLYGCMPIGDAPRFVGWWYQTDLATRKRWYNEYGGFDSEIGWGRYLEDNSRQIERIEDLVVEVQAVVDSGGVHGMTEPGFPRKLQVGAMIPRWHKAETMVESLRAGDRELLLHYLLYEQRTESLEQAEGLLREWLSDSRNIDVCERFGT